MRKYLVLVLTFVTLTSIIHLFGRQESNIDGSLRMFGPQLTAIDVNPELSGQIDSATPQSPVEGSVVNLADLPPNLYNPENRYLRWLRGEYKPGPGKGFISPEEKQKQQLAARALEPSLNIQSGTFTAVGSGMILGTSFDSLDINNCCSAGAFVPPDPELAVGPDHIIAVVNAAFEIYDKMGNKLVPSVTFETLFNGVSGCTVGNQLFDPNVLYDEQADRYMLGIDSDGISYCAAVSQSSDPTAQWIRYRFPVNSGGVEFDYPHAGIGQDAIYVGGNTFNSGIFVGAKVFALDKWAMYAGLGASWRERSFSASHHTPQPANLHGYQQGTWPLSGPHYMITGSDFKGEIYSVFAWQSPFSSNSFYQTGSFNLDQATGVPASMPVDVPQPLGGGQILANDWRPQDAEYRNGYLWTTNTVSCNPGTGTVDCIRWAQVEPTIGKVVQSGVLASNGEYRFFADLAVNDCGDMALGYTKTVPSNSNWGFPGVFVAGRKVSDPRGLLGFELPLKSSNISYSAFDGVPYRWGDYTGFSSDPNGIDLWYLGQYSKSTGNQNGLWGTYIGKVSFPRNSSPPPPTPPGLTAAIYFPIFLAKQPCW
jgi:hypothetical protein